MSECVVRMEMPESCKKCNIPLCLWINDDWDIVNYTIAAVQDFRKKNDDGFPDFCPIVCQLPEGHGRLVDISPLDVIAFRDKDCSFYAGVLSVCERIDKLPTIVPAEAERSET